MYLQKFRKKDNIPADAGHFLRKEIDSTEFKNENLTAKIRRNKAENSYFLKKLFHEYLETDKTIK